MNAEGTVGLDVQPREDIHTRRLALGLAVPAIAMFWIYPMVTSLWLDEAITWWFVRDSFHQDLERWLDFGGHSPIYYLTLWPVTRLLGTGEVALRLPSLIAMAITVWGIYRIGLRLFDRFTAVIAACLFIPMETVAFAAADARPYALATMLVVLSTLALVRWIDEGHLKLEVAYLFTAAAIVFAHYLFGVVLIAHASYAVWRLRRDTPVTWPRLGRVAAGIIVLSIPLVPRLLAISDQREILSGDTRAHTLGHALVSTIPPWIVGGFIVGIVTAFLVARRSLHWTTDHRGSSVFLLLAWLLAAPVGLYLAGVFLSVGFVFSRYFLSSMPALALLLGIAVARINPSRAGRLLVVSIMSGAILGASSSGAIPHFKEDWRGAAEVVRSVSSDVTPVLVDTWLFSARSVRSLQDPEGASFILAPLEYYEVPGRVFPAPFHLDDEGTAYLENVIETHFMHADHFVVVLRLSGGLLPWLERRMEPAGFRMEMIRPPKPAVYIFDRR